MKSLKKPAAILLFFLSFICLCASAVANFAMGHFRDSYPGVESWNWLNTFAWIMLFASLALTVLLAVFALRKSEVRALPAFVFIPLTLILVGATVFGGVKYAEMLKDYPLSRESGDYIESEWLKGIELDEFKRLLEGSRDKCLIYVGREDCAECAEFEKALTTAAADKTVVVSAYYTSRDRNGERSDEMYALLEKYAVDSVPYLILVENGRVLEAWSDASELGAVAEQYM